MQKKNENNLCQLLVNHQNAEIVEQENQTKTGCHTLNNL